MKVKLELSVPMKPKDISQIVDIEQRCMYCNSPDTTYVHDSGGDLQYICKKCMIPNSHTLLILQAEHASTDN